MLLILNFHGIGFVKKEMEYMKRSVTPAPSPLDWFHARIVLKGNEINVCVNNSSMPSLTVQKMNSRTSGKIGISNEGLEGEFTNLVIKQ